MTLSRMDAAAICFAIMTLQVPAQVVASEPESITIDPITKSNMQRRVAIELSPIKSREDLSNYLSTTLLSKSPLGYLTPYSRQMFLDSLVFTELGLASFRYNDLEAELTPSQIYQLLGLFGVQEMASHLRHARIETQIDLDIINRGARTETDYLDYHCVVPATYKQENFSVCIGANCGLNPP